MKKDIRIRLAARCEAAGRPNNEDNYQVDENLADNEWGFTADKEFSLGSKGTLLLVCDGMGGMNAGEVASEIAVRSIQEYFSTDKLTENVVASSESIKNYIKRSIVYADEQIKQEGKNDESKRGMGSTIVLAWLINGKVYVGWCGDSRAYCYNPKTGLIQLSHDHSYVQELVDAGKLSAELAFDHPHNNIITRSLGDNNMVAKPDVAEFDLHNEDIILLCSDGLCGVLRDNEIEYFIKNNQTSMNECRDALWEGSRQVGWTDNTTVVLAQIISGAAIIKEDKLLENSISNTKESSKGIKLKYVVLLVLVSLFLGVLLSFGYIYRGKVLDFCKKVESVFKKDTEDKDTEEILQNEAEENSFSGQETNDVSNTDKEQLEEKEAEVQKKNTPKQVKKNGEESKNKEEQAEKLAERFNSLSVAKDTLGNEDSSENDNVVSNEDNSETENKQEEVNVEEVTEDAQQELQKESETLALEGEQDEKSVLGDTIKGE